MDRGINHKGDSDCSGLEGVIKHDYKGVITYTNTLHPVNINTSHPFNTNLTPLLLGIAFMVTIRDTVVFCTFYDNERFKNNLEKLIRELCCKKEGDVPFDIDGDNFTEVVVDFRREKGEVLGLV
ncbi:hypothetical protein CWI36_1123p0010 [Hamiltosporidium magnivora]|uniref:Uncharacterized protein n=1 Tax=Hamiltosporidium magnivora TaxID=148818 RepID=A0A4Q9L5I0_9MICR|nr:hypothetical protein CWI36_1123p0010 [Hamiltosporidium magnivora]